MSSLGLRAFMRSRSDGYWELLATSVGDQESIRKTMNGVSADALASGTNGPAISPRLVDERLQALAALDHEIVQALASTWKPPSALNPGLTDPETDFWTAAWCAGLRFLKEPPEPLAEESSALPLALERELAVVFGRVAHGFSNWDALIREVVSSSVTYDELRKVAVALPAGDETVSQEELIGLLGSQRPGSKYLERLRIFTGRPTVLSVPARRSLERLFCDAWFIKAAFATDRGANVVLMQLVLALTQDEGLKERATEHLMARLSEEGDPQQLAPFAYLLADTGWSCP
jgi:hypothetical protein